MLVAITPKVTRVSITTKRIMVVIEVIENTIRNTTIEKKWNDNLSREKKRERGLHTLSQRKKLMSKNHLQFNIKKSNNLPGSYLINPKRKNNHIQLSIKRRSTYLS
jgi:hypothetical protein